LSDNTCPFKIVLPNDPPVSLIPSINTANLDKIVFNIHVPFLLRLLLCKEEKNTQPLNNCPYPKHINSNAVNIACNFPNKLAHVYLRHEQINNAERSCIIVFIETMYLFDRNGLLSLFNNTVNWLNIANEKPYFYIVRYGEPKNSVNTNFTSKVINIELKRTYSGYSNDEDICIIIPVEKHSQSLRIDYIKNFYIIPQ
jgi:hypothetical protein